MKCVYVSVFVLLHEKKRVGGRKGKRGERERRKIAENLCIMLQWGFLGDA